jgi:hypothetical protein
MNGSALLSVARFIKIGKYTTDNGAFTSFHLLSSTMHICALLKRGKKGEKREKEKERKRRERKRDKEKRKKVTYECGILLDISIKDKFYLSK